MDRIFLDTSFILAFINKSDAHHSKARKTMEKLSRENLYISDKVMAETVNTVFSRSNHERAVETADYLLKSEIRVVKATESSTSRTVEIMRDSEMSFTDCSIKADMESLGIEKLATFDTDFNNFEDIETLPDTP